CIDKLANNGELIQFIQRVLTLPALFSYRVEQIDSLHFAQLGLFKAKELCSSPYGNCGIFTTSLDIFLYTSLDLFILEVSHDSLSASVFHARPPASHFFRNLPGPSGLLKIHQRSLKDYYTSPT